VSTDDLCFLTIAEAAQRMRARDLSPVELTQAHLDRIRTLDGRLNSYITVLGDRAIQQAKSAERAFSQGGQGSRGDATSPLQGIPIALKDLVYTEGIRTTAGSKVLADFVPEYDATVTKRLEAAGTVLLGKLNMSEFAMGGTFTNVHYGTTRNPWDTERFAGGSSSGSGAAVAAGLALGALGTDTGGSIRGPAHNCGIVGLKPTFGRVSRHGVVPLSWSLDHVGPMTRTVEDCALILQVIAGHDSKDTHSSDTPVADYTAHLRDGVRGLRIGVDRNFFFDELQPDVAKAIEAALVVLTELGATIREVDLSCSGKARAMYIAIAYPEATAYHLDWMQTRIDDYGPNCRSRLEQGLAIPATDHIQAQRERRLLLQDYLSILESVDVLVVPTSARTAPRFDEEETINSAAVTRQYTSPMDLTGLPALVVPAGYGDNGMPVTFQVVGRHFDEATVLQAGYAYEQATDWHQRHPQLEITTP